MWLVGSPSRWLRNYSSCCLSKSDINFTQIASAHCMKGTAKYPLHLSRMRSRSWVTLLSQLYDYSDKCVFDCCKVAFEEIQMRGLFVELTSRKVRVVTRGARFVSDLWEKGWCSVLLVRPISFFVYHLHRLKSVSFKVIHRNRRERERSLTSSLVDATVGVAINKACTALLWELSAGLEYIFWPIGWLACQYLLRKLSKGPETAECGAICQMDGVW